MPIELTCHPIIYKITVIYNHGSEFQTYHRNYSIQIKPIRSEFCVETTRWLENMLFYPDPTQPRDDEFERQLCKMLFNSRFQF